jgi:hypothetical protein
MGSVVAEKIHRDCEKIIIDIDFDKAKRLAKKVEGKASFTLESAREADLVAVVLPTPAVNEAVVKLTNFLKKGAIILNMATTANIESDIIEKNKDILIIDAKVIGHALSISRGEPCIIVLKCNDEAINIFIKEHLAGFDKVLMGDAEIVPKINKTASMEGIRAAVSVRKQLSELNVPKEWIDVALRTVCAGTIKAFVENDLGHFALELVKKLEEEMNSK